jgi:sugar phosphate isomerase/epimerase
MKKMSRRTFINRSALAGMSIAGSFGIAASPARERLKLSVSPGLIGVQANQKQLLEYAIKYGFSAMISMPEEIATYSTTAIDELVGRMKAHGIIWDSTNLPLEFRADDATFKAGLPKLRAAATVMEKVGATRMNTWIMPTHKELPYRANFQQHVQRLSECAKIVRDSGIRLGMEYVGPKTLMARDRYGFIRTMREARELIAEMNQPNVGLVLDSFHWFCAGDTEADILALRADDIVTVDLNDARADLTRDQQLDNTRELPLATGVIDLKTFLNALVRTGYDGSVRAEPFNKTLNDLDNDAALASTMNALRTAVALVGPP